MVKKFGNDVIFDNGKTIVAGQRGLLLSIKNVVNQQKEIERVVGQKWGFIIYEAERKAIKEAVPQIISIKNLDTLLKDSEFGKRDMMQSLVDVFNQTGLGLLKIKTFDEEKLHFKVLVENSPIPEEYERRDTPVCYHLAGIFAGAAEAIFRVRMECKETRCAAMGEKFCEFEIMRR